MPLDLTPEQDTLVEAVVTRPIYIVSLNHSGIEENLSASGPVVFDGVNYSGGQVSVGSISEAKEASVSLPWTTARVNEVQLGLYRGGMCKIWAIPAPVDTSITEFVEADGILVMDGEIRSSVFTGDEITLKIIHVNNGMALTPRNTVGDVTSFSIAPGTSIVWEGQTLRFDSRRDRQAGLRHEINIMQSAARGRLTASKLQAIAITPKDRTLTVAGSDTPIPVVYGRNSVPGIVALQGKIVNDLVMGVVWCIGEIEEIETIYINSAAVPGGVTETHYLGTTAQTVDSTLSTAIPSFNDPMILTTANGSLGLAYSVFRIPISQLSAPPTFQAIIKGRKVYDPRADATQYSDNTALCFADLVSNPVFGLGATVSGLSAAADWDDALVEGEKRSTIALALTQVRRTDEWLELLATYGEFIYYNEGRDIYMVPDGIVDTHVEETNCVKGTLTIEGIDDSDAPTKVNVRYTIPSSSSGVWAEGIASAVLPGVNSGDVGLMETTLLLPGITRITEATGKALARLSRMQNRVRVQWVTTDKGLRYRIGDVIRHNMPYRGSDILVKLTSVSLIGYGRYRVTGLRYDEAHYPDEIPLPAGLGVVPVGAIVPATGSTVPDGWADYTDANGKYIIGAGGTYAVGATGAGSLTVGPFSGSTSSNDMHEINSDLDFVIEKLVLGPEGSLGARWLESSVYPDTTHSHAYSIASFTLNPLRREQRLIIKTGSISVNFPAAAEVFGLPGLAVSGLFRLITAVNRMVFAAATNSVAGFSSLSVPVTISPGGVDHNHTLYGDLGIWEHGPWSWHELDAIKGADHTHTATMPVVSNFKKKNIAQYGSADDYPVVPGMMILWSGSLAALPSNWALCDGGGNTPDMRDFFLVISPSGQEGVGSGDNTVSIQGETSEHSHKHDESGKSEITQKERSSHMNFAKHKHTVSGISEAAVPPYYALAVIMYAPVVGSGAVQAQASETSGTGLVV